MDRRDWLAPLFAVTIGVVAALGGGWVTDYLHERAALRQAQVAVAKQLVAERDAELKLLKEAGLRYMGATDAMVNAVALGSAKDKALAEYFTHVQSSGNDLILIADEELARQTIAMNQYMANMMSAADKPTPERLAELNTLLIDWIKQLKRDMASLKNRGEDAMGGIRASTQVVAQLKR